MTVKQKAARERFKKIQAEAKKLRAKNPRLTQAEAVKQAWAISYGKKTSAVKKKIKTGRKIGISTSNLDRMMSLVRTRDLDAVKTLIDSISVDLLEEGFEYDEIRDMFIYIIKEILGSLESY